MTIEHSLITDPNIHEPKGISVAGIGEVYVADGAGSGEFKKVSQTEINGVTPDGGVKYLTLMSNGLGGFVLTDDNAHGSMVVTNNSTGISLTAVGDTTFNTPAQYSLATGAGFPWTSENLYNMSFNTDRLTATVKGIYLVETWANIISYPGTTARVSIRHLKNGVTYSSRKPIVKSAVAGAADQITGFGLISMNVGDYLQMVVASDTSGSLVFGDINFTMLLIRQT